MKKIKKYKYIGRNGIVTTSVIIDGATKIDMLYLIADEGKVLTNGEVKCHSIIIYAEDLDKWTEIQGQD